MIFEFDIKIWYYRYNYYERFKDREIHKNTWNETY